MTHSLSSARMWMRTLHTNRMRQTLPWPAVIVRVGNRTSTIRYLPHFDATFAATATVPNYRLLALAPGDQSHPFLLQLLTLLDHHTTPDTQGRLF